MRLLIYFLIFVIFIYAGESFPQSSPDKVISIKVKAPKVISADSLLEADIVLQIKDGWHINSNKPLDENMSPTVVSLKNNHDVNIIRIIYPEPVITKLQFSQSQMALYEGEAIVKIQLMVNKGVKKKSLKLEGQVQFQPCDNQTCLFPASKAFTFELKIKK